MITVYYYCPDMTRDDEEFVADTVVELTRELKKNPTKLPISVKRLGDDPRLAEEVDRELAEHDDSSNTFRDRNAGIDYLFVKSGLTTTDCVAKLLVYCPSDSLIARVAMREQPSAVWGAAMSPLAAVYSRDNKVAIWHETLHLLTAEDCYMEDNPSQKKPDCNLDGCMMEYAAPESTCESMPFLCDKNVHRLQQLLRLKKGVE